MKELRSIPKLKTLKPFFKKAGALVGRYPVSDDEPVGKNTYLSYNVVAEILWILRNPLLLTYWTMRFCPHRVLL